MLELSKRLGIEELVAEVALDFKHYLERHLTELLCPKHFKVALVSDYVCIEACVGIGSLAAS